MTMALRSHGVRPESFTLRVPVDRAHLEDQQRINTFSKLNTRLKSIEERLEELKVCW